MAPRRRGLRGAFYPDQPCGRSYEQFKSGVTFRDGYEALAYRQDAQGRSFAPSTRRVQSELARQKHELYEKYLDDCAEQERYEGRAAGAFSREYQACRKFCGPRSQVCGQSCVTRKKACHKPPVRGTCSVEQFQTKLRFNDSDPYPEPIDRSEEPFDPESIDWNDPRNLFGLGKPKRRRPRRRRV